jgi:hypothetical protein
MSFELQLNNLYEQIAQHVNEMIKNRGFQLRSF